MKFTEFDNSSNDKNKNCQNNNNFMKNSAHNKEIKSFIVDLNKSKKDKNVKDYKKGINSLMGNNINNSLEDNQNKNQNNNSLDEFKDDENDDIIMINNINNQYKPNLQNLNNNIKKNIIEEKTKNGNNIFENNDITL